MSAVSALSPEEKERQAGLVIVWSCGEEAAEAAPRIEPLLEDDVEEIRILAAVVLQTIGRETSRSTEILEAVRADEHHSLHALVEDVAGPPGDE